jgi:HK97 family phage prohead protease
MIVPLTVTPPAPRSRSHRPAAPDDQQQGAQWLRSRCLDSSAYESRTITASFEMRDSETPPPSSRATRPRSTRSTTSVRFQERIAPEAFDKTLQNGPDVRLLVDHEGQPLARTKSGTLQLSTDSQGLHARATLDPSDPDVQRLLPKMRRGDLDQMSFAFRVPTGGDTWSDDYTQRTIREANLAGGDVSVVTYPANPNTSVAVRAADEREANCVFAEAMVRELRAGKTISAANMSKLSDVLAALATADGALDDAQAPRRRPRGRQPRPR